MSWLSEIWDGGGKDIVTSLIAAAPAAVADYTKEDNSPYSSTKDAFDAQMAFDREKMAQALEIAKMNAASGNAGAGAAVAAARIAQQTALKQLKQKAIADAMEARLNHYGISSKADSSARESAATARLKQGEMGQKGFTDAAEILSRYKM